MAGVTGAVITPLFAACLLLSSFLRINLLSGCYLLAFLGLLASPDPAEYGTRRGCGRLWAALALAVGALGCLGHVAFQVALGAKPPYGHWLQPHTPASALWQQLGFSRLDIFWLDAIRLVLPDIVVLGMAVLWRRVKLPAGGGRNQPAPASRRHEIRRPVTNGPRGILDHAVQLWRGGYVLVLTLFLVTCCYPSILTGVYGLALVVSLGVFAAKTTPRLSVAGARAALAVYSGLHCVLLYIYQFPSVSASFGPSGHSVGLVAFYNQSATLNPLEFNLASLAWPAWCYPVFLVILYVLASSPLRHPRTCGPWWLRPGVSVQAPCELVPADEYSPLLGDRSRTSSVTSTLSATSLGSNHEDTGRTGLVAFAADTLHAAHYVVTLAFMMLWALGYPSWLVLPLLLWSCLAWLAYPRMFLPSTPLLVIYAGLMLVLEFAYMVPGSPLQRYEMSSLGLRPAALSDVTLSLGVKFAALGFFSYSCRNCDEPFSIPQLSQRGEPAGGSHRAPSALAWRYFVAVSNLVVAGVQRYSFAVALLVLYVAALDEVNVLNSVYVAVLPVFAAFPRLREQYWMLLVLYCECVIVTFFLWGFPFTKYVPSSTNELLGVFPGHDGLLHNLRWHITIFAFSVIQLLAYRFFTIAHSRTNKADDRSGLSRRESNRSRFQLVSTSQPLGSCTAEQDLPQEAPDGSGAPNQETALEALEHFFRDIWFILSPLALLLAGILGSVSLLKLGYLALLFSIMVLLQLRLRRTYYVSWVVVVIYAGSLQMLKYVFQFAPLRQLIEAHVPPEWINASGFVVVQSQQQLFVYLVRFSGPDAVCNTIPPRCPIFHARFVPHSCSHS